MKRKQPRPDPDGVVLALLGWTARLQMVMQVATKGLDLSPEQQEAIRIMREYLSAVAYGAPKIIEEEKRKT